MDLGCGNGLLVYILAKEGHPGVGIDVRKRQIWDMFGSDIKLEVSEGFKISGNFLNSKLNQSHSIRKPKYQCN